MDNVIVFARKCCVYKLLSGFFCYFLKFLNFACFRPEFAEKVRSERYFRGESGRKLLILIYNFKRKITVLSLTSRLGLPRPNP